MKILVLKIALFLSFSGFNQLCAMHAEHAGIDDIQLILLEKRYNASIQNGKMYWETFNLMRETGIFNNQDDPNNSQIKNEIFTLIPYVALARLINSSNWEDGYNLIVSNRRLRSHRIEQDITKTKPENLRWNNIPNQRFGSAYRGWNKPPSQLWHDSDRLKNIGLSFPAKSERTKEEFLLEYDSKQDDFSDLKEMQQVLTSQSPKNMPQGFRKYLFRT